jgi:CRISPR-associated protein Csm2
VSNFYYEDTDRTQLREALVTTKAQAWAKGFLRPTLGKRRVPLTSAQLRRFYNDVKALETRVDEALKAKTAQEADDRETAFLKVRPYVKMLLSKVAYACPEVNESGRKVPLEFRKFLEDCVNAIDHPRDFEAFLLVFEAVVGFFYGEGGGRR